MNFTTVESQDNILFAVDLISMGEEEKTPMSNIIRDDAEKAAISREQPTTRHFFDLNSSNDNST